MLCASLSFSRLPTTKKPAEVPVFLQHVLAGELSVLLANFGEGCALGSCYETAGRGTLVQVWRKQVGGGGENHSLVMPDPGCASRSMLAPVLPCGSWGAL